MFSERGALHLARQRMLWSISVLSLVMTSGIAMQYHHHHTRTHLNGYPELLFYHCSGKFINAMRARA